MRPILNLIWLILCGWWMSLARVSGPAANRETQSSG
jgi:uncharacterized membrane protein YccF (DUF307 family)